MLQAIIWLAVGVLIGWNIPQPPWAVAAQEKVRSWFNRTTD